MITPRRTRLVRVPDLQSFRRVIAALTSALPSPQDGAVLVPTRAAARVLANTIGAAAQSMFAARLVTRDDLYDELHRRLDVPPRRLTLFERDGMAQSAATAAAALVGTLPFTIRPGLVAELLRFYDQLRRQPQLVRRFEELITESLGGDLDDRGAERLLRQTRFLAEAFRQYEQRVVDSGACDEHTLRQVLLTASTTTPLRHAVITVADWIADPAGLFVADFELFSTLPHLETVDLVCTASVLASGFHERLHSWWPGLEEVDGASVVTSTTANPRLVTPRNDQGDVLWHTHRDREEELHAVSRRVQHDVAIWQRAAVVFKRPLPYLYLAPDTLGRAGVPYRVYDTLPLAAEPSIAVVDLVLDALETSFSRDALVAVLSCPHFAMAPDGTAVTRASIAAMNRFLSSERYLGGLDRLEVLAAKADARPETPALQAALTLARELAPMLTPAPASDQVARLTAVLKAHARPPVAADSLTSREQTARDRLTTLLDELESAHRAYHDPVWTLADLATTVRRWIGDQTIDVGGGGAHGVSLLDDQSARFGDFDDVTIVGLIENEWPERPRRNIFYPPTVLKALGWPSEKDRRSADDARFLDLIASSTHRVALSTFTLDDEALVSRSAQLDEVTAARLSTVVEEATTVKSHSSSERDTSTRATSSADNEWQALRAGRPPATDPAFHGFVGARPPQPWSVSALETYVGCPFKFYAQNVLKLDEEPDDEEVMDPRRQGQFVHQVFEDFFRAWQDAGHKAITSANIQTARELFVDVVDRALGSLPEGEAALERTRLLGSSAASGLGEAVLRMEAERPVPVVERLLEHSLKGAFTIDTSVGPRAVSLRGKVDRVDLLADGTFRLIDYKLGWPPDKSRALQLPIYSVCAEQHLKGYRGRDWQVGEAVYLAFKGPKRVVPLFASAEARGDVIGAAQQRLADTLDAIERGDFPPSPDDVFRCDTCSFTSVCRKDYVGDV